MQKKIMKQESDLAQELREIGDGTETIVLYAMRLESSLASNVLSLREQRLLAVPPELFMMTHVEMLDLAWNKIKELPGEVCHLTKLKKLYLDHNQLTKLPHDLHKLGHSLTLLGISVPRGQDAAATYDSLFDAFTAFVDATTGGACASPLTRATSSPTRAACACRTPCPSSSSARRPRAGSTPPSSASGCASPRATRAPPLSFAACLMIGDSNFNCSFNCCRSTDCIKNSI